MLSVSVGLRTPSDWPTADEKPRRQQQQQQQPSPG